MTGERKKKKWLKKREIKGQRNRGRSCEVLPGGRERDLRERLERKPAWEEKMRTSEKERISLLSAAGIVLECYTGKALPRPGEEAARSPKRTCAGPAASSQQRSGVLEAITSGRLRENGGFPTSRAAGATPGEGQPRPCPGLSRRSRRCRWGGGAPWQPGHKSACQGGGNYEAVKESERWMFMSDYCGLCCCFNRKPELESRSQRAAVLRSVADFWAVAPSKSRCFLPQNLSHSHTGGL